jgi:ADP-ribose pyrophosphatase YjhB (NUDIX family)
LRQIDSNGGRFTLPGGRVEETEFAVAALLREVFEETGAVVIADDLELVHVCHKMYKGQPQMILIYKTLRWSGQISNNEPQKFREVGWYELEEVWGKMSPTLQTALYYQENGVMYSEFNGQARPSRS